ncbi:MAG: flagellar export chaperone FlgN [Halanaerobium sp.]
MEDLFKLYQKLKSLTEAESEIIAESDFESLKEKLAEKNKLIDQIDRIDQKEYFAKLAFSIDQKKLEEKKNELYQLIQKISELQLQNMKKLEKQKEENKEKMISLYSREKSIKGYLNPDKYEAKFFDEKS